MTPPLLALARRLTGRLLPRLVASDISLRRIQSFQLRVASQAAPGATALSFESAPDDLAATMADDQFAVGALTHTVTSVVVASNGLLGPVLFSPALGQLVPARAQLTLRRETTQTVKGLELSVATDVGANTLIATRDWRFLLVGDSLLDGTPPEPNDMIQSGDGQWLRILSVAGDPARALYHVTAH